jgi:flagellin FlaB
MKANRKFLMDNERGDIGVGTLIIFIAMVLVAAVAATVLIYTTGALQQKASKTSKEATQQISTNIIVEQVMGNRSDSSIANFNNGLIIRVKPDVGTTSIDLRQMIITVWDKSYQFDLNYSEDPNTLDIKTFTAQVVRDEDHSFNLSTPVLNSGDLVKIIIPADRLPGIDLTTRKTFWITLNLELGSPVNLEITTPNSFGVNQYVMLYP